jgi:hypothetical protein
VETGLRQQLPSTGSDHRDGNSELHNEQERLNASADANTDADGAMPESAVCVGRESQRAALSRTERSVRLERLLRTLVCLRELRFV